MDSPFLRLDNPHYAEMLTDAALCVLMDRGVDGLSVRAMAGWMKVTPESILNRYSRAQVIELLIVTFGHRWLQWVDLPHRRDEIPTRLPESDAELHGVRVHHALAELARSEQLAGRSGPAQIIVANRADERALLRRGLMECGVDDAARSGAGGTDAVDGTSALISGLRLALAEPEPTLTYDRAVQILRDQIASLKAAAACRSSERRGA